MNAEGKKTSSFEIPCSIFDIQDRADLWLAAISDLMPGGQQLYRKEQ